MKTRHLSTIICISLLATFSKCQRTPAYAQSARLGAPAAASTVLQHPELPRLVAQLGHSASICSVAFSPDGRYVLTGVMMGQRVSGTGTRARR